MLHPSTAPLSNVKLKRVSEVYHVLYNDRAGEKNIYKCQHTEEFMIKVRVLLYYVHTTTYDQINFNWPRVLIMNFYRLVRFNERRCFCNSLSVRVYDSGQAVTHARKFCTNKPGHKIYRCMSARSTQHHTLLHNPTILHTKTFFVPACHPRKKM